VPRLKAKNWASTSISSTLEDDHVNIDVLDASGFPSPPFRVVIGSYPNAEIVEIQEVDGNTLKCLTLGNRGLEETTRQAFGIGAIIENVFTAGCHMELNDSAYLDGGNALSNYIANQQIDCGGA